MSDITTHEELEALYGPPSEASLAKVADHITPQYRQFIQASPFAILATCGPEGLDCSPRGDMSGFVRVADQKTLMLPDRRGNNRIDSLKNIVRDPRVALLFMIPGSGNTIRVNGKAGITVDPEVLDSFAAKGQAPRTVTVITINEIYFQCARAIVRSHLWDPSRHVEAGALPTPGDILIERTANRIDGAAYDREWPERAKETLW